MSEPATSGLVKPSGCVVIAGGTGKRKSPLEPQMTGFVKIYRLIYMSDQFSSWEECSRFCVQLFQVAIVNEDPGTVAIPACR